VNRGEVSGASHDDDSGVDRMAGWLMSTDYLSLPGVVGMLVCLDMDDTLCSENNITKNVGFK
jgi:hypothetical protein